MNLNSIFENISNSLVYARNFFNLENSFHGYCGHSVFGIEVSGIHYTHLDVHYKESSVNLTSVGLPGAVLNTDQFNIDCV